MPALTHASLRSGVPAELWDQTYYKFKHKMKKEIWDKGQRSECAWYEEVPEDKPRFRETCLRIAERGIQRAMKSDLEELADAIDSACQLTGRGPGWYSLTRPLPPPLPPGGAMPVKVEAVPEVKAEPVHAIARPSKVPRLLVPVHAEAPWNQYPAWSPPPQPWNQYPAWSCLLYTSPSPRDS